jgi:outer membrane protein assembly factor BamB
MDGRSVGLGRAARVGRLTAVGMLLVTAAGCWPAAGQGPDRAAYNPFETVITPRTVRTLAPVWTATTDSATTGGVVGPPVVSSAGVHVSDSAALYTFDKATGQRLWSSPNPASAPGAVADPIVDGRNVLFSSGIPTGPNGSWTSYLTWLDARTGMDNEGLPGPRITGWRNRYFAGYWLEGSGPQSPARFGLGVINTADLEASWSAVVRSGPGGFKPAPPATLGAQRLYYAGTATESYDPIQDVTGVRAFSLAPPASCTAPPEGLPFGSSPCPLWSTVTSGQPVTSPVLGPGETALYLGTDDGTLLALDTADGHVLWTAALGAAPSADPALADGRLYVPLTSGDLVVLTTDGCGSSTCGIVWRAHLHGAGVQPAVAGGVVFVGTDAGSVVALPAAGCNRSSCRSIWHHELGAAVTGAPAVSGGRLYVGVAPDEVVAFAPT